MVGVALELLPTPADMLDIDIPKDLPNNQEIVGPSNDFTFRGVADWIWARMRGEMWTNGDHLSKWAQGQREA